MMRSVPPGSAENWFTPRRFALVLALLVVVSFAGVVFGWQTFVHRDFGLFGYPVAQHHRDCFWRGELPLWNPFNNCGLPFLAQWNTMVLYPPTLLYLLLPLPWSLNFFCLVHLFGAGLGMYVLAERWTGNRLAGALAGTAFAFNGLTLNALMWPNNIAALAGMPWVIWLVEAGWRKGGRSLWIGALVGAVQMLTGAPEIILFTWLLLALLWAGQCWRRTAPRSRLCGRGAALVALVAGLSAAQLLPFLDLLRHSHRSGGLGTAAWSMPAWGWANFLVPLFRVNQSESGLMYQPEQFWTSSYYGSIGILALALWALWRVRRARVWWLALALFGSLLLALGEFGKVHGWLRFVLPAADVMRFPIKFVTVAVFVIPVLAAFAQARWSEEAQGSKKTPALILTVAFLLAIAAIIGWAFAWPLNDDDARRTLESGWHQAAFLVLTLALAWAAVRKFWDRHGGWVALGLVLVTWADVLTHAPWQNPTAVPAAFAREPTPPGLGEGRALLSLGAMEKFYRWNTSEAAEGFALRRLGLHNNVNLIDGVPKVDGFFSLYLPMERQVHHRLYLSETEARAGLADFLGVTRMTAATNLLEWSVRPAALPWITAGPRPVFAETDAAFTGLMAREFNPREVVFLPLEAGNFVGVTNAVKTRIVSRQWTAQRITAEVEAEGATVVVFSQADYHSWQASVDGVPAKIWPANVAFQAVAIPPGRHRVELVYRDGAFRLGALICGLSCLLMGVGWSGFNPRAKAGSTK